MAAESTETEEAPPGADDLIVSEDHLDEEGFATIWNIISDTCEGDLEKTREVAARVLGFLCKHRCDFVVTSSTNAEYLDGKFEQDKKLLHNWKADSEMVDMVTQHAEVPFKALKLFLATKRYKPDANYSPTRANRIEWFQEDWNIG